MSNKSTLNIDGVMLFEQPFARVPYENYKRVFRTSQKNIEKEFTGLQNMANDVSKRNPSPEEALKSIESMIAKAENLKRKLADLHNNAGESTQKVMRTRFEHLAAAESYVSNENMATEFSRWADTRLDRWLVDWMLRTGREKTARKIAAEKSIEYLVDIDLFSDIRRIEAALLSNSCTEALAWCNENKTQLRKIKSTLEFELRLQEYVELARERKTQEAIAYSKKYLSAWQDTHLDQIRQASALLAFPPTTNCGPYKRLYDRNRRVALVNSFRLAIYTLNTLPTEPLLHLSLYAGLAALKLPACKDPLTINVDCPVCDSDLGILANEVPLSHHVNSTIVCRISGKIMNEDNGPMAFPNGNVYSREALEEMAAKNNGMVTCPRTHAQCEFSALRKMFIS